MNINQKKRGVVIDNNNFPDYEKILNNEIFEDFDKQNIFYGYSRFLPGLRYNYNKNIKKQQKNNLFGFELLLERKKIKTILVYKMKYIFLFNYRSLTLYNDGTLDYRTPDGK